MKSLLGKRWFYYLMAIPPGFALPAFSYGYISFELFLVLTALSAFVYYPILIDLRLEALGVERPKSIWKKIFLSGWINFGAIHSSEKK